MLSMLNLSQATKLSPEVKILARTHPKVDFKNAPSFCLFISRSKSGTAAQESALRP